MVEQQHCKDKCFSSTGWCDDHSIAPGSNGNGSIKLIGEWIV